MRIFYLYKVLLCSIYRKVFLKIQPSMDGSLNEIKLFSNRKKFFVIKTKQKAFQLYSIKSSK